MPSPAGWVVQIKAPGQAGAPPAFRYFNVAIADANLAVEAIVKQEIPPRGADVSAIRQLSPQEIATLRLKSGAAKPA